MDEPTPPPAGEPDTLARASARSSELQRRLSELESELGALAGPPLTAPAQVEPQAAAEPSVEAVDAPDEARTAEPVDTTDIRQAARLDAARIRRDAQQQADAFLAAARRQVGELARLRIGRITELADDLARQAEEVLGRLHVTAAARAQLDELVRALGAAAEAIAGEAKRTQEGAQPPPAPAPIKSAPVAMSAQASISFARGAPSLDIVDVEGLRAAAARAFTNDAAGVTGYGTAIGYPKLRAWIAEQHGVAPENVIVTNGSMQADAFLFEELVSSGDDVVVERPTYDRTLLSLRQRGAHVQPIALEPDGIDTDALGTALRDGSISPRLAHVIPNFQNPAGYTLSAAKREALVGLAREHDFIVFEDDPYVALRFRGETLPTMYSMDPERVVYASSFSKTVCPGIRVGYLVGSEAIIRSIVKRATNTYISPSMVSQGIVYEFCQSGAIERSIETVKVALSERVRALGAALERELPEADFVEPDGGYFMWVTLPEGTDVSALFKAAGDKGVVFVKGTDFLLEGGENTLRLAYSGVTVAEIDEGVARLAAAAREVGVGVPA